MLERWGPVIAAPVVLALLLAVVPGTEQEAKPVGPAAEERLLAAYERSRNVEVVVVSTFTRVFPDDRELVYDQRLVQRPPDDRLVIGAGSASGRIGGRIVRCNADASGTPECLQGADAGSYGDEVAAEMEQLAALIDREDGAYEVSVDEEGCFRLTLVVQLLTPPYGLVATFCFDGPSGALAILDVERPESIDRSVATEIRTVVTAADLRAADLGDTISTG